MNRLTLSCSLMLLGVNGYAEAPKAAAELRKAALAVIAPLPDRVPGAENDSRERIALGRTLFHEKRLSVNESQSCNSCHRVDAGLGGVDNEAFSPGAFGKRGGRNAPTVLNAGFHVAQFWDGRAATLEDQAKGPVLNPVEMAMPNETEVVQRLSKDKQYPALFAAAFAGEKSPITYDNMAKAIAAFERTLVTRDRFDDFLKGDDQALSGVERKGLELFMATGCTTCHNGPLLGGNAYHKLGLVNPYPNLKDKGREEITKDENDRFKFKVPSLRNIGLTAPYFHDGAASSLGRAVEDMGLLQLGKQLTAEETQAVVAFLHSLSDKARAKNKVASR
jgi:cytochrome c peroxidase